MGQVANIEIDWSENAALMLNTMGMVVGSVSRSGSGDDGS